MSKEMDLLKRILATGWLDHELSCEVEELLAQPEYEADRRSDPISKLRNLRDIQGRKGNYDIDEYMRGLYNGLELSLSIFEDRSPDYKEHIAQPEEEGVYQKILRIEDGIEVEILPSELWLDGYETGRKDPQKRESLSEAEIRTIVNQLPTEVDLDTGIEFCIIIEKAHGIMETVPLYTAPPKFRPLGLEIMDVCGSEDYREGFKDGALYAEKCHGIGGGE